jgi:hypothetical protein
MVVDLERPARHRPETLREQNLRIELVEHRRDALALCDHLEPRLRRLHGATVHLGPEAEQLAAGALYHVRRYRTRNDR